jgi:4-amino-4-deoxy-L-arabinose transferase-like glycosyltransferase
MTPRAARLALAILAILAIAVGIDNLDRPLANPDEGRYSEISREMVAGRDWVTPRLNGLKYFEKPPLQYWAGAAALAAFGDFEFAARLYTLLAGLATILLAGYTAARVGSTAEGLATMAALVASPYFFALAGVVTLDMGLTLWTTATFCAWMNAELVADDRARRRWMLAAWAAMALAVLSKGLVGIVIPAAGLALACVARSDFTPLARLEWTRGLAVFAAITVPWFVAVSLANPEFAEFFFVHEHFNRFLTTTHGRREPWWYFLPILAAGLLPWLFVLPAAIGHAWRSEDLATGARPMRFALLFSAFVVVFFSVSGSKLPTYILPAFPAIAMVLGRYLAQAEPRRIATRLWPVPLAALALAFFAWRMPDGARDAWMRSMFVDARPWALAGAGILAVAGIAAAWLAGRGRRWHAIALLAIGSVAMVGCAGRAYVAMSPRQSGLEVATKMRALLSPRTRLYSVATYDQTVPFYIGRTFTLVGYVDEFATGLASQPERHLELAAFPAEWQRPGDALAIMNPDKYEAFRAQGLPMRVVHQDPRRILVRKP